MSCHDAVKLSQRLVSCPSVTPQDAGALDVLQDFLKAAGFICQRKVFHDVDNLYAKIGTSAPNLCFAGHTDVVPPGDETLWSHPPFAAEIAHGRLFGRGTTDMKCAIAAFAVAAARFVKRPENTLNGSISLLITGDEEGPSINGTVKLLPWISDMGETLDGCIVGEPTNPETLGTMMKIGRRGSMNMVLTVTGTQGHSAYPDLASNPVPRMLKMLTMMSEPPLDQGSDHFQPSTLTITTVDVGNVASNVIPSEITAAFNIRFNDLHSAASMEQLIRQRLDDSGYDYKLDVNVSGTSFISKPGKLTEVVAQCVEKITGHIPEASTTGGTSDARFIKDYCPVVEFGLTSEMAHKTDENVAVDDIIVLSDIYEAIIEQYLS